MPILNGHLGTCHQEGTLQEDLTEGTLQEDLIEGLPIGGLSSPLTDIPSLQGRHVVEEQIW
jgi:hypothetical protein